MSLKTFNLEDHLTDVPVIKFNVGKEYFCYKEKQLGDDLKLTLSDNGEATLEFMGVEVASFKWDDEAAEMFTNLNKVKALDLFALMKRKHWLGRLQSR